jgi:rRNA methylases
MYRKKTMDELERLTPEQFKQTEKIPVVVLLDNVRSMHNVGSVFRTADSFAIQEIILCGVTPRPPHRDIQKTALGATETVTWSYHDEVANILRQYKQKGFIVLAVEQTINSQYLNEYSFSTAQQYVIVFGNEVEGVSEEALSYCDGVIEIPQFGSKHSLNISVSAGIVLWEVSKWFFRKQISDIEKI